MKFLVTMPAHAADKDKDGFKANMAASLGVDPEDVILVPAGVAVIALDVPGPSMAESLKGQPTPAEITRLCKQLWEEEDGPHPHSEDHEETTKLLTAIGEPAVPELRKWAATGHGPGNKRCSDLADHLDKSAKHKKTEHEDKKPEKQTAKDAK